MPREAIDLSGYLTAKKTTDRTFDPAVPDTAYADSNGLFSRQLNVDRLPQTDIVNVLIGEYEHSYQVPLISAGLSEIVDIARIVRNLE